MTRSVISAAFLLLMTFAAATAAPIHDAAEAGDLEEVRRLIGQDAELVGAATERGTLPLHIACAMGEQDVAKYLLDAGADIDAVNDLQRSALHYAVDYDQPHVVRMLLKEGASLVLTDLRGETALHVGAARGVTESVRVLLAAGCDVEARNDYERTPLLVAARESGSVPTVQALLDAGADIDAADRSNARALELAAWRGFSDLVDLLLERDAEIPDDETPRLNMLTFSLDRGLPRLFDALLEDGVRLNELSESRPGLVLNACAGGSVEIIRALGQNGFDLDYADRNGWTALHNAAEFNRSEIVEYLLSAGVDIDARTAMGENALHIARNEGSDEAAALFLSRGVGEGPPDFPPVTGEYLGQRRPGGDPEPFAPGIVCSHYRIHSSVAFSPDGEAAFWNIEVPPRESGYSTDRMLRSVVRGGRWTYPEPPGFVDGDVPFFAPDGKRLYFISTEPLPNGDAGENIWFVERTGSGWSGPTPVDAAINSVPIHWQFSVDESGTFYIGSGDGRILVAEPKGDGYETPVDFRELHDNPSVSGDTPYISPAGDYLLFSKEGELHAVFLAPDGAWTDAVSLGEPVNSTTAWEMCPLVTPDGNYLVFKTERDGVIGPHWVAIGGLLDDLRERAMSR